jgi:outer membrane immunogenic protein
LRNFNLIAAVVVMATSTAAVADEAVWSGLYVGLNGGYGTSNMDVAFLNFSLPGLGSGFEHSLNGSLAGGHVGAQHQIGPWVIGIETTFDGGNLSGSSAASATSGGFCEPCSFTDHEHFTTAIEKLFTVAGRLGYSRDRMLGYFKGGFASADIRESGAVDAQFDDCSGCGFSARAGTDARHNGWILGGGFEYLIDPHVTLGLEYGYIKLDGGTDNGIAHVDNGSGAGTSNISLGVNPEAIQTLTARLTILLTTPQLSGQ